LGTGCAKSSCGENEAAFAIDKANGRLVVAIFVDTSKIDVFGAKSDADLPPPIDSWMTEKGKLIKASNVNKALAPTDSAPQRSVSQISAPEQLAIHIGAFNDEAYLPNAKSKLVILRLPHYTEQLSSPSGLLTRLRAGPFSSQADANKALEELKAAGIEGRVVAFK
jgi:cell division septation protein DedD